MGGGFPAVHGASLRSSDQRWRQSVSESPVRILLVTDDPAGGERVTRSLVAAGASALCVVDHTETIERGLARSPDEVDVIVVETRAPDQGLVNNLETLHEHQPAVPIIVLADPLDEVFAVRAMRAGVLHCLPTEEALQPRVVPLILDAVRSNHDGGEAGANGALSDAEFGTLHALCGPVPSPVSARSFGMRPLVEKSPDEFRDLARDYTLLLRRAIEALAYRDGDGIDQDLNRMVERLGILSAGPRDLIDMHKVAISAVVGGETPLRAKAFAEEGRLFLLRLMGYLVGYYRMLSWGRSQYRQERPAQRTAGAPASPRPSGEV